MYFTHICAQINQSQRKEEDKMTKIDIVSGFLGAGKTTFIQKMLKDVLHKEKVVLIEILVICRS